MPNDFQQMQADIAKLQQDLAALQYKQITDNAQHVHGASASVVSLDSIGGLFEVVSIAPTLTPNCTFDQIKIYVNGATLRLYWYDYVAHNWHYVTATA